MAKDDVESGLATVGPLTPELWYYTFNVDGVSLLDSANANIPRDGTRYPNYLIVDGALSDAYKIKDVPHGNVSMVWYDSPTLASASPRRMYVYTPPGYDRSTNRYPVLYLLHGAGGDEDAWNNMGRASVIMDDLIAANRVKPMHGGHDQRQRESENGAGLRNRSRPSLRPYREPRRSGRGRRVHRRPRPGANSVGAHSWRRGCSGRGPRRWPRNVQLEVPRELGQ